MVRYRTKPVEVEAVQYDGANEDVLAMSGVPLHQTDALRWSYDAGAYELLNGCYARLDVGGMHPGCLIVEGPDDDHLVKAGDWIISGEQGALSVCSPEVFAATYEPVEA